MSIATEPDPVRIPFGEDMAVYGNDIEVWHTAHDVVLDLYALGPREPGEDERPSSPVVRVRLPPTMVLHVTQSLANAVARRLGHEGL